MLCLCVREGRREQRMLEIEYKAKKTTTLSCPSVVYPTLTIAIEQKNARFFFKAQSYQYEIYKTIIAINGIGQLKCNMQQSIRKENCILNTVYCSPAMEYSEEEEQSIETIADDHFHFIFSIINFVATLKMCQICIAIVCILCA